MLTGTFEILIIILGKRCSQESTDELSEQDGGYLTNRRGKATIESSQHRRKQGSQMERGKVLTTLLGFLDTAISSTQTRLDFLV